MIYYKTLLLCGSVLFITKDAKAASSITLYPSLVYVFEGESVNLTCAVTKSANYTLVWTNPSFGFIDYRNQTNECKTSGPMFQSAVVYRVYCNDTAVTVTIHFIGNTLQQHWTCLTMNSPDIAYSSVFFGVLTVNVKLTTINSINTLNIGRVSLRENSTLDLQCTSSYARPYADIKLYGYNDGNIHVEFYNQLLITTYENNTAGLTRTISIISFKTARNMDSWILYCKANNSANRYVKSNEVYLDILYPPSQSPVIQGLGNGSTYFVIENSLAELVCFIDKSNPLSRLSWSCGNVERSKNESALNELSRVLLWKAHRSTTYPCACQSSYERTLKTSMVVVDVLYPPENVTVSSMLQQNTPLHNIIRVIEYIEINIYCSATSNPAPSNISWSGIYTSVSRELRILSNRNITGNLICSVSNTMMEAQKNKTTYGNISKTYEWDVLYPPSIQTLSNISVIENNSLSVVCKINQGNPSQAVHIRWINTSFSTFGNESVLEIEKVNKKHRGWYRCEVNYTLVPTFGDMYNGTDLRQFYLDVLFPPEDIKIKSTSEPTHNAYDRIRMIENTALILFCSAKGNPTPSFSWSGLNTSDTSTVNIYSSKTSKGNITCSVSNMMNETLKNDTVVGKASKTLFVDILYSPVIFNKTTTAAVEGEDFVISCVVNPEQASIQSTIWFGRHIDLTKNNTLIIHNVTRHHAGNLTCNASYTMIPTFGETHYEIITKDIVLDVLYKATVSNFSVDNNGQNASVTVNEYSDVRMVCIVDSNPYSTVNISIQNKTVALKDHTPILEYNIRKSSCNDTGIYECSGHNFLNQHMTSLSMKLRLFVNCLPRSSSTAEVQQNITVSQHSSATLTFVAMAYPPPQFNWFRVEDTQLIKAENGYSNMKNISEYEIQINFLLIRVTETDFGEYLLKVNNTFGEYRQSFFLLKPENNFDEQNTPDDSIAGPIAGGVIGSVLAILAIAAAVFLIRKRAILNKSIDGENKHEYQNVDLPRGNDCTETIDGGIPNVYEQLQIAGSDQQYQQLTTFAVMDNEVQRIVYENLRIRPGTD